MDGDALGLEPLPEVLGRRWLLVVEEAFQALDDRHLSGTESTHRLCHLDTDHPAPEHEQPVRDRLHLGDVAVVPRRDVPEPVDRRHRGPGPDGNDHAGRGSQRQHRAVALFHLDRPFTRQPPVAADEVHTNVVEPLDLRGVVEVADERIPVRKDPGDVHVAGDRRRGGRDAVGMREHLGRTQQRLGRHAAPVAALAPDEFLLDDDGREPALGRVVGRVLARRASADHDHVVGLFAHHGVLRSVVCAVQRCRDPFPFPTGRATNPN